MSNIEIRRLLAEDDVQQTSTDQNSTSTSLASDSTSGLTQNMFNLNLQDSDQTSGLTQHIDQLRISDHLPTDPIVIRENTSEARTESTEYKSIIDGLFSRALTPFPLREGEVCSTTLIRIFEGSRHFRPNLFRLPSSTAGRNFIEELTRTLNIFNNDQHDSALFAFFLLPKLILQKPSPKAKAKEMNACLNTRLNLWNEGNLDMLYNEACAIQTRLTNTTKKVKKHKNEENELLKHFVGAITNGNVGKASRILFEGQSTSLPVNDYLIEELQKKHPPSKPAVPSTLIPHEPITCPQSIYTCITGNVIHTAALKSNGGAGPSGLDSHGAKRILCSDSFGGASQNLCESLAIFTRKLCTEAISSERLLPFLSCTMMGLDKNPGVRPIGIGEIFRRIVTSALLSQFKEETMFSAGPLQTCGGMQGGIEAAIHSMNRLYESDETEGILLIDADNAFNRLNRKAALHNMKFICPSISGFLNNAYKSPVPFFIGDRVIMSSEGTTQGDTAAMVMYALGIKPIIYAASRAKKIFYADDGAGAGTLRDVFDWWNYLNFEGPNYGYFPKPAKTILIVKPEKLHEAQQIFGHAGIQITTGGSKYLGSVIGQQSFKEDHIKTEVAAYIKIIERLSNLAQADPHAALSCYTNSIQHKWTFIQRVTDVNPLLWAPLEHAIASKFIPALFGSTIPLPQNLRCLLTLPARNGGLNIKDPAHCAQQQHQASSAISAPLVEKILNQEHTLDYECLNQQSRLRTMQQRTNRAEADELKANLMMSLPNHQRTIEHNSRKGASTWLTAIPLTSEDFHMNKSDFRDLLKIRYLQPLDDLPRYCVCGHDFTTSHALSCAKGGFILRRHNGTRDLLAKLLDEVCFDVSIEPHLQRITPMETTSTNREDGARLDVAARNFWREGQKAFFDIRVFNASAPSNSADSISRTFEKHETEKINHYRDRVLNVEHGSFTPLVYSTQGDCSNLTEKFHSQLAKLLSEKRKINYSIVTHWLRTKLNFCIMRAVILCLRGSRKIRQATTEDILIATERGRIT